MATKVTGIIAHTKKPGAANLVEVLREELKAQGISVLLEQQTASLVGDNAGLKVAELSKHCDLLLVLGGDGTILQVLHEMEDSICPVFGINLGSLGFLTGVSSSDYRDAIKSVVANDYILSERTLLEVEVWRNKECILRRIGLNDVVVSRGAISRLIKLQTSVDGVGLTEYNADGLIVATPTGSTAYSLSAGGPVLSPDSGVFVITPICPHVLTNRSIIVADRSVIEIVPVENQNEIFLTVDGQELIQLTVKDSLRIVRAEKRLPLAMLPGTTFFELLQKKLKWSGSAI